MYQKVKLEIERDHFARVIRRFETVDGEITISSYQYNDYGDLMEVEVKKQDVIIHKNHYRYEYDEHRNKIVKHTEFHLNHEYLEELSLVEYSPSKSTYHYNNEYEEGKLVEKTCLYENSIIYKTKYYYKDNKLIRIEKYSKPIQLKLWRTEMVTYEDDKMMKSIYMPNEVLSHYSIDQLEDGIPISRQLLSPVKGKYYWELTRYDKDCCSVYVGVTFLTAEILLEIVTFIDSTRQKKDDYILLIIECVDTIAYPSDQALSKIGDDYRKVGINITYAS